MNFSEVLNIVLKLVMVVASALVAYVIPVVRTKLAESVTKEQMETIDSIVRSFVIAAEQTMSKSTGAERKAYVEEQLQEFGIEVTTAVNAMIERAVVEEINGFVFPENR